MVAYDYSKEPNNPWDLATWDPQAQIEFMRRMRYKFGGTMGNAEARITQRIAQSDTKGMPPSKAPLTNKIYIIKGRPGPAGKDGTSGSGTAGAPILGFTGEGPFIANERFMLAPTPVAINFPAALASLSSAVALISPTQSSTFVLTADPNEFLANGDAVICSVTFGVGSQIGAFAWGTPVTIPASTALYVIAPPVADPALGGVQILFRGDPA